MPSATSSRYPLTLLAVFAVWWGVLAIAPWYRQDWLLENLLVFLAVPLLVWAYPRLRLSNTAYTLLLVFFALHAVGAHYTYAEVPYDHWVRALTGHGVSETFGLQRNQFDRLVHFAYGLLVTPAAIELLDARAPQRGLWRWLVPLLFMMAHSTVYEMIEWGAATAFGGDLGQAYLGTQGDVWDAQKDSAMAALGAAIAVAGWRRLRTGTAVDGGPGSSPRWTLSAGKPARSARGDPVAAAAEKARARQPVVVGIVGEQELSALERVNHLARDRRAQGRATETAPQPTLALAEHGIDVARTMHDDGAGAGVVVHAWFEAVHAQRVAVAADIGVVGFEQAEAGLVAPVPIGKRGGEILAAVAAVRHVFAVKQAHLRQVEDPQPSLGGRARVIDHRQARSGRRGSAADRALARFERQ